MDEDILVSRVLPELWVAFGAAIWGRGVVIRVERTGDHVLEHSLLAVSLEPRPSFVPGGWCWWLPSHSVQPGLKWNHSCSFLPGPREAQALGSHFGHYCNPQWINKGINLVWWNISWMWGWMCRKTWWRAQGCVQVVSGAKGHKDVPAVLAGCSQVMAGLSSSWFLVAQYLMGWWCDLYLTVSRHGKGKPFFLEGGVEGRAEKRGKTHQAEKCRSGTDHTFSFFRNYPSCISFFFGKYNFSTVTCVLLCARATVCSCQTQEDFVTMWDKQWRKKNNSDRNDSEQS